MTELIMSKDTSLVTYILIQSCVYYASPALLSIDNSSNYFIIITREVMLTLGIIFPILIMLLKEHESKSTHRK
jgi:hypothetical protein